MSHIQNIEIKNFKSIRHAKIEDCRRVNVFIGYPNVGKSNLFEAINFLSYLNKDQDLPLKDYFRFNELIDIFSDGNTHNDAEIKTNDFVAAIRYLDKNTLEAGFVEWYQYIENFNESTSSLIRFIRFEKNGGISRSSSKDYSIENKIKKYTFKEEGGFVRSNQDQRILDYPYGANLADVIRYDRRLRKECGELFAIYNLKLIFDENGRLVVQKQLDEYTAFQFSFSQVADTLQRLIFHKAAILTNENSILLFEEPEAHMFPAYISKFTSDIAYAENNNQYFITTHSPFVLNDFISNLSKDEVSIYVVGYKSSTGETLTRRLNSEELHEMSQFGIDIYMNLENYLPNEQ